MTKYLPIILGFIFIGLIFVHGIRNYGTSYELSDRYKNRFDEKKPDILDSIKDSRLNGYYNKEFFLALLEKNVNASINGRFCANAPIYEVETSQSNRIIVRPTLLCNDMFIKLFFNVSSMTNPPKVLEFEVKSDTLVRLNNTVLYSLIKNGRTN